MVKNTVMKLSKIKIILLCFLLAIFCSISIASALRESLTYDEPVHIQEGENALLRHTFAVDPDNPPFERAFAVIPLVLHIDSLIQSSKPLLKVFPARMMILLLGICLALAVFFTAYIYIGETEAFIALILLIFNPDILAYDHYISFEIGFSLFFFLSYIFFIRIVTYKEQTTVSKSQYKNIAVKNNKYYLLKQYLLLSLTLGLGLSSKVSFPVFFLISAFLLTLLFKRKQIIVFIWRQKNYILLTFFFSLIILWATYFFRFDVVIAHRDDTKRVSYKLTQYAKKYHIVWIADFLQFGEEQKLPFGNYLAMIKNNIIRNSEKNSYYFLGKLYPYPNHKWYFLPINVVLKTPIPLLFLFISAIIQSFVIWRNRKKQSIQIGKSAQKVNVQFEKTEMITIVSIFLIPIICILSISSIANMFPRIRYVLPIYPFIVLIAALGTGYLYKKKYGKLLVGILLIWYVIGTLLYFPHFISYSNELLGVNNKKDILFIDSDIDWGQSIPDMVSYMQNEKPQHLFFSYNGRDRGDLYGLVSKNSWGSYKYVDICAFHDIPYTKNGRNITAISIVNWYYCGYYLKRQYKKAKIKDIIGESIIVF